MDEQNEEYSSEIEINVTIAKDEKKVYIGEENSSDCEYKYDNTYIIGKALKQYLDTYVIDRLELSKDTEEELKYDGYDRIICEKIVDIVIALNNFKKFNITDFLLKKDLGLIPENATSNFERDARKYYESLLTPELEKYGLNSMTFYRIYQVSDSIVEEMENTVIKNLVPYITAWIMKPDEYEEIRQNVIKELENHIEETEDDELENE